MPDSNTIWRGLCAVIALITASLAILSAAARHDSRPAVVERAKLQQIAAAPARHP